MLFLLQACTPPDVEDAPLVPSSMPTAAAVAAAAVTAKITAMDAVGGPSSAIPPPGMLGDLGTGDDTSSFQKIFLFFHKC